MARHLIAETDHQVLVLDKLTYAGNLDSLQPIASNPRYSFVQADILDAPKMREVIASFRPDIIMHLAAESHVDRSIDGPGEFIQTNVVGTYTLLQAALGPLADLAGADKDAFRFHHISTDEVFGSLGAEGFFTETTAYDPRSPYSASKAASDHLVRAWHHTFGLPIVVSNCSNNYGPYHFPEKLIPLVILNALEGKPLPVYGDGSNVRDWLYVEDHARALVLIARTARSARATMSAATTRTPTSRWCRRSARSSTRSRPMRIGPRQNLITFVNDRPGHDQRYAIDATKIGRELGWVPQETFETGLAKTVRWYLDNRPWWERIRSGVYRGERLGQVA